MDCPENKMNLEDLEICAENNINASAQLCILKTVKNMLGHISGIIGESSKHIPDIDINKITRTRGSIGYAQRTIDSIVKLYMFPRIDGPRVQEMIFDDNKGGITFYTDHAKYTKDAAIRTLQRFHAKWRLPTISDVLDDDYENVLDSWALLKNGSMGKLTVADDHVVTIVPVNDDVSMKLFLVRKKY